METGARYKITHVETVVVDVLVVDVNVVVVVVEDVLELVLL